MNEIPKKRLAVILPCFDEQDGLTETISEIFDSLNGLSSRLDVHVIVIDDHSKDETYQVAKKYKDNRVSCIRLSRRSGSHIAIRAGLRLVDADAYTIMAADGQDDPNALIEMIELWNKGVDIVWALRRQDIDYHPWHIRMPSSIFYAVLKKLSSSSDQGIDLAKADFFLFDQKVREAVNSCSEQESSLFGLLIWMGFKQGTVKYDRRPRRRGVTSWSFAQRMKLAKDWIITFSEAPLKIVFGGGAALFSLGAVWLFIAGIYSMLADGDSFWRILLPVVLLLGGVQLLSVGLIGVYIKKAFDESKKRPLYFIEEKHIQLKESANRDSCGRIK